MEIKVGDGVAGWRGILGWVCPSIPSSSQVLDFHSVVPEGIELKMLALGVSALNDQEVEIALTKVDDAVTRLAAARAAFISVEGILPLIKGVAFDKEIIKRVQEVARVPATTSLSAAVDAMRALNLKKLVMASPMTHEVDRRNKKFLEDSGFEVLHIRSLNISRNGDIAALPRNAAYGVARRAYLEAPQAEGIYAPCGGWCPPFVIDALERDLGVPVINGRQASTWAGLKALGIKEPVKGWGKLFETLYRK